MPKQWIELDKGIIVETSSIRNVTAGSGNSHYLFIKNTGETKKVECCFGTVTKKWEAYDKLKKALLARSKGAPK